MTAATAAVTTPPSELDAGRLLFAQSCTFVAAATRVDALPSADLPEVACAGRSNVGKSSLLNALTGRRALARTSSTPGRTRALIFFDLGGRLRLVDLPGYGYARAPRHAVRAWTRLIEDFLRGRPNLRRALVLVDSRVGMKDSDEAALRLLDVAGVATTVVLTKADKASAAATAAMRTAVEATLRRHPAAAPSVAVTSAATGEGIAALRAQIASLAPHRP